MLRDCVNFFLVQYTLMARMSRDFICNVFTYSVEIFHSPVDGFQLQCSVLFFAHVLFSLSVNRSKISC